MRFQVTGFTCEACGYTQPEDLECPVCKAYENWTDDVGIHETRAEILEDLEEAKDPDLGRRYLIGICRTYDLITPRQRQALFPKPILLKLRRHGVRLVTTKVKRGTVKRLVVPPAP